MSSEPESDGGTVRGSTEGEATPGTTEPAEPAADGFGRKGWALTGAVFVCVLVIPGIIYAYPYAAGALGLSFFGTYLVLPLIPAVLLGLIAVWSMTAATADGTHGAGEAHGAEDTRGADGTHGANRDGTERQ